MLPPTSVSGLRMHPVGDRGVLVQLRSLDEVLSLHDWLQRHPLPGQVDAVAAAETVLITADSAAAARGFAAALSAADLSPVTATDDALVTLDTVYDGADLDEVARLTGLSRDGVIAAHAEQVWTAAFGGFAPGFAYLVGDGRLAVPRRDTPRPAVPAGAVALADRYSAVYPRASPGGWQLIGRTNATLWNLERPEPALVRPGNRVQFRSVRELVTADSSGAVAARIVTDGAASAFIVVQPGAQTTVQDLGRPGFADLGVTRSGALDRGALRRANRLAGNPATAAVLENALGGLVLDVRTDQVLAMTGAALTIDVTNDGVLRTVSTDAPFAVHAGDRLALGTPTSGMRCYVAVRGGFDVAPVLGSRSTDTMSGLGPAPLAVGSALRVLPAPSTSVVGDAEPSPEPPPAVTELRYVPGPRADWIAAESLAAFTQTVYTVSARSNRIGLRLDGPALSRSLAPGLPTELPSEGTVYGAIQIPASGLPVLFLADHPVTGGYPVVGVVLHADLDRAAQLPAGARLRFVPAADAASPLFDPSPATRSEG
ncbi:5-oxoprolinase/urea amidolyase family protein [Cryobacterium melibiosiphilum]|uniref:5-oxoprolinase/urea amidolyase family protein n=1 Tax=Cryobacterium melibiosiphilum TaxID=995039 RepID=A0A3A5MAN0_9MICO|nr:5-oxoprolinase/urea amidolyase family protein [Cryobacterium melibiosiphilum]RJT87180.1 5-oxoprolinase/urea amidolyase family protein [Cryobacterium melibiosiphilum]